MATEPLFIPEERLEDVIRVIRSGLRHETVHDDTKEALTEWCNEEEEYLKRIRL